jgi:hypothetical protein
MGGGGYYQSKPISKPKHFARPPISLRLPTEFSIYWGGIFSDHYFLGESKLSPLYRVQKYAGWWVQNGIILAGVKSKDPVLATCKSTASSENQIRMPPLTLGGKLQVEVLQKTKSGNETHYNFSTCVGPENKPAAFE